MPVKSVSASEAKKRWFRLLDKALQGEVIAVERRGQRLVLRREDASPVKNGNSTRQYKQLLRVPRSEEADRWSWEWRGAERQLAPRRRRRR